MVPVVGIADQHSVKYTNNLALFHFSQQRKLSFFCSLHSIVHVNGCYVSLCEDFISRQIY